MSKRKKPNPAPLKDQGTRKTPVDEAGSADRSSRRDEVADRVAAVVTPPIAELSGNLFSRYFSFAMLLGIIVLVAVLFYEVMASFLVPLFLAAILVVIFRPLHRWILDWCRGRESLAALLTTLSVLLAVLIPLGILLLLAAAEGQQFVRQFNNVQVLKSLSQVRTKLGLDLRPEIVRVEDELQVMQDKCDLNVVTEDLHRTALYEAENAARALTSGTALVWPDRVNVPVDPPPAEEIPERGDAAPLTSEESVGQAWHDFVVKLESQRDQFDQMTWSSADSPEENLIRLDRLHAYQQSLGELSDAYAQFKVEFLGGRIRARLAELVNPSREVSDRYLQSSIGFFRDSLFSIGGKGAAYLGSLVVGTAIMIIALYFFLLDGPKMIETFKGLSPIDDEHEQELVSEFARVSRAVVVATLLSALVQGLLAGIGFYFAGLESVFLLTVLSGVMAMVPFVGAAAVWLPCALYLYFVGDQPGMAIGLGIYGVSVVSMADNLIKPLILHGQSNLHPLLALLSVLGGVGALGPIGILVGPMVVAFLQTLLKILQREMMDLGGNSQTAAAT